MKKNIQLKYNIALFVCSIALAMSSCIDDKGNYDYSVLSMAVIEESEKHDEVAFTPNKQMRLDPKVSFTEGLGLGDYTFEWHYFTYDQDSKSNKTVEVISKSNSPVLDIPVPPILGKQGTYDVLFKAINNQTNVAYSKQYIFRIQNVTQLGYLALCEKNGGFDIELIALYDDTLTLYKNYLASIACELPRAGRKPINIATFDDNSAPSPYETDGKRIFYSVFILTDQGTDRLKAEDYSYKANYNVDKISYIQKEFIPARGLIADRMYFAGNGKYYMLMNNNWYYASRTVSVFYFSTPINTILNSNVYYKAAPHIAASSTAAILFDEDNHRFMWQSAPGTDVVSSGKYANVLSTSVVPDQEGDIFSFNKPNGPDKPAYNLIHMTNVSLVATEGASVVSYAIVENPVTSQYELLRFSFSAKDVKKMSRGIFPSSINMADIKFFAEHTSEPFLYLATETQVFSVLMTTMAVKDITSSIVPSGHKISMFKNIRRNKHEFALGTYDPGKPVDECGTLQFFRIDRDNGDLNPFAHPKEMTAEGDPLPMRWDGLGKIVGLDRKEK